MSLIVLIVVVVILLALAIWGIQTAPIPAPLNWILQLCAIMLAILVIGHRAGLF